MAREGTGSLFDEPEEPANPEAAPDSPLAERMRPRTIAEFVGQGPLLGEGRLVRRLVEGRGHLPSLVLWGPPGTGKRRLMVLRA